MNKNRYIQISQVVEFIHVILDDLRLSKMNHHVLSWYMWGIDQSSES